jgi:hypothetical protein
MRACIVFRFVVQYDTYVPVLQMLSSCILEDFTAKSAGDDSLPCRMIKSEKTSSVLENEGSITKVYYFNKKVVV